MNRMFSIALLVAASSAASAHTHAHIGIAGVNYGQGPVLEIRAGYINSESDYSINDDRQLFAGGHQAELLSSTLQTDGPFSGWYAIDEGSINPTSDFFASTLTGADTYYEIVSAIAIDGSGESTAFGYHLPGHDGGEGMIVSSAGADLDARSIHVPAGSHFHGFGYSLRDLGTYEITLRAYDANGVFASTELSEVRFLVTAVPTPGALGVLGLGGLLMTRRRR